MIHSVTKLLAGHSDVTLGYVACRTAELRRAVELFAVTTGLTPSPFDCWLAERGLLSFHLRYDRAEETAARLADHLAGLPGVRRVIYPLRADHPDQHEQWRCSDGAAATCCPSSSRAGARRPMR